MNSIHPSSTNASDTQNLIQYHHTLYEFTPTLSYNVYNIGFDSYIILQ